MDSMRIALAADAVAVRSKHLAIASRSSDSVKRNPVATTFRRPSGHLYKPSIVLLSEEQR
jgi:hypothetical protein